MVHDVIWANVSLHKDADLTKLSSSLRCLYSKNNICLIKPAYYLLVQSVHYGSYISLALFNISLESQHEIRQET